MLTILILSSEACHGTLLNDRQAVSIRHSAFTFSKRPKEEVGRLLIVTAESSIRIFRMDMLPFEESHAAPGRPRASFASHNEAV